MVCVCVCVLYHMQRQRTSRELSGVFENQRKKNNRSHWFPELSPFLRDMVCLYLSMVVLAGGNTSSISGAACDCLDTAHLHSHGTAPPRQTAIGRQPHELPILTLDTSGLGAARPAGGDCEASSVGACWTHCDSGTHCPIEHLSCQDPDEVINSNEVVVHIKNTDRAAGIRRGQLLQEVQSASSNDGGSIDVATGKPHHGSNRNLSVLPSLVFSCPFSRRRYTALTGTSSGYRYRHGNIAS